MATIQQRGLCALHMSFGGGSLHVATHVRSEKVVIEKDGLKFELSGHQELETLHDMLGKIMLEVESPDYI